MKTFRPFVSAFTLIFVFYSQAISQDKKEVTIKVLCYNIHHAEPPSKKDSIDLDAIARVIIQCQPDLVALQEVDVHMGRSGSINQAEELGRKTNLTHYFIKAIDHDGGEYGVAILSRFPMTNLKRYPLPMQEGSGGETRVLGTATITLPGKQEIVFACTHLDAQRDSVNRELQINAIMEALKGSTIPVIIAGDFNATRKQNDPRAGHLFQTHLRPLRLHHTVR